MVLKIVCNSKLEEGCVPTSIDIIACNAYRRQHDGQERPETLWGSNKEAKDLQAEVDRRSRLVSGGDIIPEDRT